MAPDDRAASAPQPRRVVVFINPGVAPLDVVGPLQVFELANALRHRTYYDVVTAASTAGPVLTTAGLALLPSCAIADLSFPIDTLMLSGGRPDAGTPPAMLDWLRRVAPRTRRFGSISTGTFALGAAGLLDGKRVTTHWAFSEELARRHPAAKVEIDSIFVRDEGLFSTAGLSAGIDLALSLIEEDHGADLALDVARHLVLFIKRPGGQAQLSAQLQAQFSSIPAIQKVREWCYAHLDDNLRIEALAKRVGMSERSFIRAFRKDTSQTPAEFVTDARLQAACRALEETALPPKAIAERCGFGSPAVMRRIFIRRIGTTPTAYRQRFRGPRLASCLAASDAPLPARSANPQPPHSIHTHHPGAEV